MNKTDWKEFERLVAAIHRVETQGADVRWNEVINGRQFDITLRFKLGLHDYLTVIECKKYKRKVPVEKIDAFATKARDVNANKAVFVSSNEFQSGCIPVAQRHGIKLLTVNKKIEIDTSRLTPELVPSVNIYKVSFILQEGKEYILEDEGGRLEYLLRHISLSIADRKTTPNEILSTWSIEILKLHFETEYKEEFTFPKGTIALIPYDDDIIIEKMRFSYKLTKASLTTGPTFDNHILEGLGTRYEMKDENGNIISTTSAHKAHIGFDTKLEQGKFYSIPHLHNHYYCESIKKDCVHFILIESYQFGMLLQTKFVQNTKYSYSYIEVTDKGHLIRLNKMLKDFYKLKAKH